MQEYLTKIGDTADYICWKYYGSQDGQIVEQLLAANPGLSDRGPVLPAGITIYLPEIKSNTATTGVRLWE